MSTSEGVVTVDREARQRLVRSLPYRRDGAKAAGDPVFLTYEEADVVLALLADIDTAEQRAEKLVEVLRALLTAAHDVQAASASRGDLERYSWAVGRSRAALAEHGDVP